MNGVTKHLPLDLMALCIGRFCQHGAEGRH